ncbi:hypothetical protein halTADL_1840 [Halohasta litchfieldiae]|uniref:Uncharacterized protein n=1 Tax=Halohasta litchfieldiae TaxID=1073996 RepID=A0A1H6QWV4_9EURY|nr:hypothetical protein [Halohasta litchfieldiae]ATW88593.1 hypothetical protein halTADL_1840 [Halohasta litchfieldiae]SEI48181.1 hypothetical protein SAMN05444271_101125 [Halohasta litchfieldiae]
MYESTFPEEWTQLGRDEAVERAYALGVAAACGNDNREEYEAIKAAADSTYDRSLIELSFEQGRSQALQLESSGTAPKAIWDQLVDSAETPTRKNGLPDALGPAELLDRFDQLEGPPETLDKPSFLSRGDKDNA